MDFREVATEAHKEMKRIESRKDLSSPFVREGQESRDQEAVLIPEGSVRGSLQAYANLLAEAQTAEGSDHNDS